MRTQAVSENYIYIYIQKIEEIIHGTWIARTMSF